MVKKKKKKSPETETAKALTRAFRTGIIIPDNYRIILYIRDKTVCFDRFSQFIEIKKKKN